MSRQLWRDRVEGMNWASPTPHVDAQSHLYVDNAAMQLVS